MKSDGHIVQFDYLRTFAIISVVVCHVTESIYKLNLESMSELDTTNQVCALCFFTFGRLGVPVFLFLTGYLLLDRAYDDKTIVNFWKRNLLSLLATTEIWIVFYNLFLVTYNSKVLNWKLLVKELIFFERVPLGHMWYMPMIIGIYLFVPFIANALKGFSLKNVLKPYFFSVFCLMILPCLSILRLAGKHSIMKSILSLDFSGGVYGLILLAGYIYKKSDCLKNVSNMVLIFLMSTFYLSTVGLQLYCYAKGFAYNVWYNNFLLIVCSFSIFIFINKMKFNVGDVPTYYTFVKYVARYSFGIYLVHYPIILVLKEFIGIKVASCVTITILSLLSFVLSFVFVHLFSKIKRIGKLMFYIKD